MYRNIYIERGQHIQKISKPTHLTIDTDFENLTQIHICRKTYTNKNWYFVFIIRNKSINISYCQIFLNEKIF